MLYLAFKEDTFTHLNKEGIIYTNIKFESEIDPDLVDEDFVDRVLKDIDDSTFDRHTKIVYSNALGFITLYEISGGAKTLILMKHLDNISDYYFRSSKMGNNCVDILLDVSRERDIYLYYNSILSFPEYSFKKYKICCLESNTLLQSHSDFIETEFNVGGDYYR